ncbi:MAG: AAA family ATPase [Chloroflexi bacterium]|nr:AAA family ATPase [Chloroflexota bacterium]
MPPTNQAQNEKLHITLLGEFRVQVGETAVSTLDTRCQSLLAYLILNRDKIHTRRQIAFHFWPDSTEAQARTNLRKAIYHLRHHLPQVVDILRLGRKVVEWRLDAPVLVDVMAFETAVSQAQQATIPTTQKEHLLRAIDCYHGDFLPDHYDDWVLTAREQLRQQYLACLETLTQLLEEEQEYAAAITCAQRLLHADPLHEVAYRRLMQLQAQNGNVVAALRTYHTCTTTLQRELGTSPSRATQQSYEQLLNIESFDTTSLPVRPPLVGRGTFWATMQEAWQRATTESPLMLYLFGEAGIGKTRLAEELMDWAARQGITTATAVCYAAEGQLPYAPVAEWLRAADLQKVIHKLDERWQSEITRILPELLIQHPELSPPGPLREGWQRQHLFVALAHAMLAVRQPLLLFVDDLQWCDHDTLEWLRFLLHFDTHSRLLLVGTARSEEITPNHPLITLQQHLRRHNCLIDIDLDRLNAADTQKLATHIIGSPLDTIQATQLYTETEGNPLFIVEMAQAGLQLSVNSERLSVPNFQSAIHNPQSAIKNLPPKVRAVIELRLSQLSSLARELIDLAAVIGRSFTFDLLNEANGEDETLLVRGLDELWQRRIVREQGADAYDFSHDKIRQVAYANLSSARRRLLHGRIVTALETLHTENLDKVSGQLALHYEAAQQLPEAVRFYQRAAKVSNRIFAHQETMQYLRRAIALLPKATIPSRQQVELYELLGDVLALTGEHEVAQEMFETAVCHTPDTIRQSQLYRKIGNIWPVRQGLDEALRLFQTAEDVLGEPKETDDTAWRQEWLWIQIDRLWALYLVNSDEEMVQLSEQMRPVLNEYGLPIQRGFYFQRLMLLGYRRERYVLSLETIRHAQASLTAIEKSGHISQIAFARFALGMTHLWYGWHGNLDEAETHMQTAQGEAEEISDVVLQSRILTYLTLIYRRRREIDKVRDYLPRAMALSKKANMLQYIAQTQANMAWLAWFDGDLKKAQKMGQTSLENCKLLPTAMPFWGMGLWPLICVNVAQGDIAAAVTHAQLLLDPMQLRMTEGITAVLQQAIVAWEANQSDSAQEYLQKSIQLAQEMSYL